MVCLASTEELTAGLFNQIMVPSRCLGFLVQARGLLSIPVATALPPFWGVHPLAGDGSHSQVASVSVSLQCIGVSTFLYAMVTLLGVTCSAAVMRSQLSFAQSMVTWLSLPLL